MMIRALRVVGVIASPFVLFAFWSLWEVHQVTSFCEDVHQGASLGTLPVLAARHGIGLHWMNGSVFDAQQRDWVFFVPAKSTMGDYTCAVHHDKVVVISAKIDDMR